MIKSFKDKETELIYRGYFSKKIPSDIQKIILRKLLMINASSSVNDLRIPPSNHLEKLSRDLKGWWSIKINDQFRIIFKLDSNGSDVIDVMVTDYH
ncbi:MAG: type II toxin-antitoxin system RelE/ParE family toxin [Bacilli bacterium]|nr:type II toxin-antitoxin system RelE/ParE family toxin [Bacilli bacterium]